MSLLTIASETLVNIANAIRAKTGRTATMTPAQMVTEIGSIQGGGGASLPSSISAIDGGEFTFSSDTNGAYQIMHSLGDVPKGFVIWTDEINVSNATNNIIIRGLFIVDKSSNGGVTSYMYQMGTYNNNFNNYTRLVGDNYSGYANATYISYNISNITYKENVKYKWFAWI